MSQMTDFDPPAERLRLPMVAVAFRVAISAVVLAIGAGIAVVLTATAPAPGTVDVGNAAVRVVGIELRPEPIAREWLGYGTVEAVDMAMVPSRVATTVLEVPRSIRAGVRVTAGTVLARLDPSDYDRQVDASEKQLREMQAELDRIATEEASLVDRRELATRELELASSDLERVRDARERGAALPREIDLAEQKVIAARRTMLVLDEVADMLPVRRRAAEARVDQLASATALARSQVERCEVVAPFDGVIADVLVTEGEQVVPGAPIARLLDPDRLELPLRIPATARGRVRVGDRTVVHRTVRGEPREGRVIRISPEDEPGSRTMTVYVDLDESIDEFVPGLFVAGRVIESQAPARIVVPRRSIRNQRVLAVRDGRVEHLPVETLFALSDPRPQTGLSDRQWLVLADGLPAGTVIVVDGSRALEVGAAVEVLPPTAARGSTSEVIEP
jgi:RND family efflux transporter MFP subunit